MQIVMLVGMVLLVLFNIAIVVFLVAAPFFAWIAYFRVRWLRKRVLQLESELARLRQAGPNRALDSSVPSPSVEIATVEPRAEKPPVLSVPAPKRTRGQQPGQLEGVLGRQVLGWAAVAMVILAVGYFLQYAFANEWIGPLGQVSLGVLSGVGLCLAGWWARGRQQRLLGEMLTACGAVVLYLATFCGFGFYHLMPPSRGGLYLAAVVALVALLAIRLRSPGIALVALIGGLTTPLLLPVHRDQYLSLFAYLLLLDAGVLIMSQVRRWHGLAPLALIGIQGLFFGWFNLNFHPEKMAAALSFQGLLFLMHTAHDVYVPLALRRPASRVQLLGIVLTAALATIAGVRILERDHWLALAPLAVLAAIHFTADVALARRRIPADGQLAFVLMACGLAYLALAMWLRFEVNWATAGWAIEALILWWLGLRTRTVPLRVLAGVLFLLAFVFQVSLLAAHVEPNWFIMNELFVPLFNFQALAGLIVAGSLLAAAWQSRILLPGWTTGERGLWLAGVLGGVGLIWLVLSGDVWRFCRLLDPGWLLASFVLSILWAAYAGGVLAIGFWRDSPTVRYVALGLFAIAMLKALLIDTAALEGGSRVLVFFFLATIMGLAAWGYQRLEAAHRRTSLLEVSQ